MALVDYTNAGKSSLMRALTGSQVLVEDKLFATLDTTVRILQPETHPRVLVSDTVGFIKQLPHDLVAFFRSTLAEALEASLLLFMVDGSDPTYEAQLEVSRSGQRGTARTPCRPAWCWTRWIASTEPAAPPCANAIPTRSLLSAHTTNDVSALRDTIIAFFEAATGEAVLVLPYAEQGLIGEVYESARVLSEADNETGRFMKVRDLPGAIAHLQRNLPSP